MKYDNWTPRELIHEITKLKEEVKEVRKAQIDKLWPTYYNAQISAARTSMEAMTKVLKCGSIKEAEKIAETEIASLIEFIDDLEKENANTDITINLGE